MSERTQVMHYRTFNGTTCGIRRVVGRVRYTGRRDEITCKHCLRRWQAWENKVAQGVAS